MLKTKIFVQLFVINVLTGWSLAVTVIDEGLNNSGINSAIGISGKAVNFVMGAGDDYKLTSVVLGIGDTGEGAVPIVRLWSDDGTDAPVGSVLETLSNPVTFETGANTFTSTGTVLQASTTYWIVVENESSDVTFKWPGNNADTSVTSDIGATHTARIYGNSNAEGTAPGEWNSSSSVLNQIQVYATAVQTLEGYDLWATTWSTDIGAATNDFDSDGINNLYEYAMDGNPTNGLAPTNLPVFSRLGNGFIYVHPKRSDDTNITYTVETSTDLVAGSWTNNGYTVSGTNITGGDLNFVTNDVDTVENEKFIRLRVE